MEALPPAGYSGLSLTLSSLLVVLLLASRFSPSHSSNIGASAAAATSSLRNHTGSGRIADDMGLEYLIDSLHTPARILAGDPSVAYATLYAEQQAGCGRTIRGKPYGQPCLPGKNPDPNCSTYKRDCHKQ